MRWKQLKYLNKPAKFFLKWDTLIAASKFLKISGSPARQVGGSGEVK